MNKDLQQSFMNYPQAPLQTQEVVPEEEIWETMTFDEFPSILENPLSQEQKSLKTAKEELQRSKRNLEKEKGFIHRVCAQSPNDIVNFDVRGAMMTVKRSTLRAFKDSQLGRQFDDAMWPGQHGDTPSIEKWSHVQVIDWLKHQAEIPGEVTKLFEETKVNGLELLALGCDDLKELGVHKPGTLALIIRAIKNLKLKSQNCPIFIDHDPYCFGEILDQLRLKVMLEEDYKPLFLSDIKKAKQDVFATTVDYYFPGDLAQLVLKTSFYDTSILSHDQVRIIDSWIDEDMSGFGTKLLYRASRDGRQASNFHDKCDNQGPTITVIRSTGGYIFGGFCDTPWSCEGRYKASPKAFTFTIKCCSGLGPTKMKLKQNKMEEAVYHRSDYGPSFGDDIDVFYTVNSISKSHTNVGRYYELPPGQEGDTFLTGSRYFDVSEVEVFRVHQD